jgi:hypothetical protein
MRFARWVFTAAGIYGLIVITPLYFLEGAVARTAGPVTHPEYYYGFVGTALAFQVLFLIIGHDPVRLRAAIPACLVEKFTFPAAVWPLYLTHRAPLTVLIFSNIDLMWFVLFAVAWFRTRADT